MRADMRVLFAALLWLLPTVALAQYPSPTVQNFTVLGTTTANGGASFGALNNTPIGNTTPSTGSFTTLGVTGGGSLAGTFTGILSGAGASVNLDSGAASFGGTLTLGPSSGTQLEMYGQSSGAAILTNTGSGGMTLAPNGSQGVVVSGPLHGLGQVQARTSLGLDGTPVVLSDTSPRLLDIPVAVSGTWTITGTPLGITNIDLTSDTVDAGTAGTAGLYIYDGVQNGAVGPRSAVSANLQISGTPNLGSGTDVAAGTFVTHISSPFGVGSAFVVDPTMQVDGALGALPGGADVSEMDILVGSGTTLPAKVGLAITQLTGDAVRGYGRDSGLLLGNGSATPGWKTGIGFGDYSSAFPIAPFGVMIGTGQDAQANAGAAGPLQAAGAIDVSQATFSSFVARVPFSEDAPLQAQGISAATRLTSDGAAANGYLYRTAITNTGSGYTGTPSGSVTGCAATVQPVVVGAAVQTVGVVMQGSACPSNTTISVSGGGGSGATATAIIAGNTLNFPINSAIEVHCIVVAQNSGGTEQLGEHIYFGAKQGATPGTTAILGSPSWVSDFSVGTPTITFGTPTADTTLGAINITATPSAGTWSVGGSCHMVGTQQVL